MFKSKITRLTETLEYIETVDAELAQGLYQLLQSSAESEKVMKQVGGAISLSGQTPRGGDTDGNNSETQRDALRGLLLCQRVYLTDLWSPRMGREVPGEWPQDAFTHWRFRSEAQIREGLLMYAGPRNVVDGALADAAAVRSAAPDTYLTARRNSAAPPVGNSCFDQVAHWLLAAGCVSLRWLTRYGPNGFDYSGFGTGTELIRATDAMPKGLIRVPRGRFIRLYTDRRPGGHFMVSDGDGWGWGYNNSAMEGGDGEGLVTNGHARCLIHRQFGEYREDSDKVSPTNFGGKLVVFDPAEIPNAD